ncbi:hypothetical protein AB6A40_001761 [Gnathostoma spinigerum]|uniref:ZP domain-containing protein n=1 Tax=Gnathostoma spinigerum TaxID=75299 RepID=A0ABD6EEU8_9BILA
MLHPTSAMFNSAILIMVSSLTIRAILFDNEISGEPQVECGHDTIKVRVKTAHGTPSYIFAKGHFRKEGCVFRNTDEATFVFGECNIDRKREINPAGMAYSLTIIVQLHPLFITKVDRAYNVRCFYMELSREVNAELGVSEITTAALDTGHAMPQCSYTLHKDTLNGPVLRYAHVGDIVYHVWDCPSDVYAMLVHTCYILDGTGTEYKVIDEKGCPTDEFIIPQLSYSSDLTRTFTGASVVNLPDRDSVYFSCQIRLCFKAGDACNNITPPNCAGSPSIERDNHGETSMNPDFSNDQLIEITPTIGPETTKRGTLHSTLPATSTSTTLEAGVVIDKRLTNTSESIKSITESTLDTEDVIKNMVEEIERLSILDESASRRRDKFGGIGFRNKTEEYEEFEGSGEIDGSRSNIGIEISRQPRNVRRTERKPHFDETLDVDVSSMPLNIIDEGFEYPDTSLEQNQPQIASQNICVPYRNLWIVGVVLLFTLTIFGGVICHLRFHSRKSYDC